MIIRKQQLQSLEEVRSPAFDDFMVNHLRDFTPLHWQSLGEAGIRNLITAGIQHAKAHGLTHRGPVRFYIESIVLLGIDFDTDPQYPEPRRILQDPQLRDQTQRADRLHGWIIDLLEMVGGPDRQYAQQALCRARAIPFQPLTRFDPKFEGEILRRMAEMHPEKVAYLGDEAVLGLIPRAVEEANRFSVATDAGICLFLGLMYAVGHGVARDPKYPWVLRTLTNPAISDADRRVERLYSKTMTYLDHVLSNLQGHD